MQRRRNNASLILKGGYYTSDTVGTDYSGTTERLENYVAEGFMLTKGDALGYNYMVVEKTVVGNVEITPDVAAPDVNSEGMEEEITKEDAAELTQAAGTVEATGMVTESLNVAEEITQNDVEAASKQLKEEVSTEDETVTLYVQTFLEITPKNYNSAENVLKLDITPMVQIVASTAASAENIVLKEDAGDGNPQNAVIYRKAEPLDMAKKEVAVSITLPETFKAEDDTAYVLHRKEDKKQYVYTGTISGNTFTFTNPNGFSEFIVYAEDPAAARVYAEGESEANAPGVGYMTLQDAVNAVKDGGTIVVKADGKATVSASKSFTVVEENGALAELAPGSRYRMEATDNEDGSVTYTFTYRGSSSSSSEDSVGTPLPVVDNGGQTSTFLSDTYDDLTVNGRYQFRITSLDGSKPVMTVSNANFTVSLASQSGSDYFYVLTCAGAPGSTALVSVNGVSLLTATVGGASDGVISDTTAPFTVAEGGTYQFRLTAAERPAFAAGSPSFTVEYAGNEGNDWFFKVHAVGKAGDSCGFYINGASAPVAVATIA